MLLAHSKERTCPNCSGSLRIWDTHAKEPLSSDFTDIISISGGIAAIVIMVTICATYLGIYFAVITFVVCAVLLGYLLDWELFQKPVRIYKCGTCESKFTGEKLKPFEWSDYV